MKRLLDVSIAGFALLLLLPALTVIAAAVWIEDRGSPWYRGVRVGRGGREFRMLKFRSMRPDAWKTGVRSTASGDVRITRVGRWLRAGKLDELPQLWNVLTGVMSLVGPRPQVRRKHRSLYGLRNWGMLNGEAGHHGSGVYCVFR